jgi:membrane-associated phospholipid phosphatase
MALLAVLVVVLCAPSAWAQKAPAKLPPLRPNEQLETAGPDAASPKRNDANLPDTARTSTGDLPLGGAKLRAKVALPPLKWDPSWARFTAGDYIVTGLSATAGVVAAIIPPIKADRKSGPILFDKEARNFIRIDEVSGRFSARDASDSILSLLITYPIFIDSMATAWWLRGNSDVARQMALIDLEAMAITVGIQGITNVVAARERPYGEDCGVRIPGEINDCTRSRRYRSFFSGHSAQAFTAANLMCYHHMQLRLLGPGPGDMLTCISGLVAAGSVATLRMAGDMHYASDVLVGSAVGTLIGIGVPFMHYHGGLPTLELSKNKGETTVSLVPAGMGVSLVGKF